MALLDLAPNQSTLSVKTPDEGLGEWSARNPSRRKFRLSELLFAPFRDIDEGISAAPSRPKPRDNSGRPRGVRREPKLSIDLASRPDETPS